MPDDQRQAYVMSAQVGSRETLASIALTLARTLQMPVRGSYAGTRLLAYPYENVQAVLRRHDAEAALARWQSEHEATP